MNAQMKGLLKGLRYISKIFDGKEEQEMQIGHPTDVKHVAHIGWDEPPVNAPTWMNEFPSAPHSAPIASDGAQSNSNSSHKFASQGSGFRDEEQDPTAREQLERPRRRRQPSCCGPEDSTGGELGGSRHSRKHQSDVTLSVDSLNREASDSSRRGRRHHHKSTGSNEGDADLPAIPKQSRQRKTKGLSGSGSKEGSSRSKARSKALVSSSSEVGGEDGSTKPLPTLELTVERREEEEGSSRSKARSEALVSSPSEVGGEDGSTKSLPTLELVQHREEGEQGQGL